MSVEEFAMGPAQSGLLDDREIVQLFLYFTVNPKPNVGFLDTPRCCMTGKELTVNRFPQTESRWGYSGTTDRIRFTVDQRIFVVGFGLYGSYFGPSEYEVHLQVCYAFIFHSHITDSNLGLDDIIDIVGLWNWVMVESNRWACCWSKRMTSTYVSVFVLYLYMYWTESRTVSSA